MQLSYVFLANNAEAVPDGRLHIFGADFNTIAVPAFPALLQCVLVAKFSFDPRESGDRHAMRLEMRAPDREWVPLEGNIVNDFTVGRNELRPDMGTGTAIIANLTVTLGAAGTYHIRLLADDREMTDLSLYVYGERSHAE